MSLNGAAIRANRRMGRRKYLALHSTSDPSHKRLREQGKETEGKINKTHVPLHEIHHTLTVYCNDTST